MIFFARYLFTLLSVTFPGCVALAESVPVQVKFRHVASVTKPVQVTHAGDGSGRLFIVSHEGKVLIHKDGGLLANAFLDITARVVAGNERGLFSIAFPPGYASKRYFYISYSRKSDNAVVLSRFHVPSATPDSANAASEQVLLAVPHSNDQHLGGQTAFGPDGYLYWSLGDGGPQGDPSNNSQNPELLLGKLLRIDTESGQAPYAIPSSNPFVNSAGYRAEIMALGLRNPWRFSFDRQTGDLYLADVGQYQREEVNIIPAGSAGGQNFGWRIMEGSHPYIVPPGFNTATLTRPAFDYSHHEGTSITGGFIYRGPPSRLSGLYVFADFGARTLMVAERTGETWVSRIVEHSNRAICGFGEDEEGRLYAADYNGSVVEVQEDLSVRPPAVSPGEGWFTNAITIYASTGTPDSSVHYTTDGSEPTTESPIFPPAGLPVDGTTSLRVKAFHASLPPSSTVSGTYAFSVSPLDFATLSGPVMPESGKSVKIVTSTADTVIRYTVDGSVPDATSAVYTGAIHFPTGPATLRAIGYKPGYLTSRVISETWIRPTLPTPTLGQVNNVFITGKGDIHYTLDGSEPTELSPRFAQQFAVTEPTLLRARSFRYGYYPSPEASTTLYLRYGESGSGTIGSGSGTAGYANSPLFYEARYKSPEGICMNGAAGYLVSDTGNHAIRQAAVFGAVGTLAGNGTPGYVNATGTAARFRFPRGICRDTAGNVYVADDGNHVIRKIDTKGKVTTYAGSGLSGTTNGSRNKARFLDIQGLAMDAAGNLFVGSLGIIRKVTPSGKVSNFATLPNPGRVNVTITSTGRMFATDSSHKLYEIMPRGTVKMYAGGIAGYSDGQRGIARFQTLKGLSSDLFGALYVCDGHMIRQIRPDGRVITNYGYTEGNGLANLSSPHGLAVGSDGMVWIADTGNHRVRRYLSEDWDRDGIPDAKEGGTTPFVIGANDREIDSDNDGQSNWLEYIGGSDPRSGASRFEVKVVSNPQSPSVEIQWMAATNRSYKLEYTEDLIKWIQVGSTRLGHGGLMSAIHEKGQAKQRFYRVTAL
ncbi:MAG: PQQ-dependent sugar dehydrogenase [Verrucomicrobiota bacterium]